MSRRTESESFRLARRSFIGAAVSGLVFAPRAFCLDEVVIRRPSLGADPFTLGIASGDPWKTGFVIWTRLAPKPLEGGGMPNDPIGVRWEVAEDEGFSKIVRKGEQIALPQLAHSVHVEVDGLEPDRWYHYRFFVGDEASPVGRGRTMPSDDHLPEKLKFTIASCQHWESGLFTAYEHMAKDDLDLVFHLGDYIYEGAGKPGGVRQHTGGEIMTLDDYRNRHAQYKTDEHLKATHARFPWVVTWDDHELDNNCAGAICQDAGVDPVEFLARRANAYQAYYEHMPLRKASIPSGPDMKLYRRIRFGQLAEFSVLDTRQYRSDQPNGDGIKPLRGEAMDPRTTMLGRKQEGWLCQGLIQSPCRWNVLAQQVMMARVDFRPGAEGLFSMDQWGGYDVERKRLLDYMASRHVPNPVVLTGDIHSNWCNNLLVDFDDKDAKPVATEFVCTSIASGGDGKADDPRRAAMQAENPFVKFANSERGYVRCTVTGDQWQGDYQVVEYVTRPGAPLVTRASFVVENGEAGAKPA